MEEQRHSEEEPLLADYAQVFWRRRWYVLAPVVLLLIGAALLTLQSTPVYRADALMRVNAAAARPDQIDPFSGMFISRTAVPTYLELVKTPTIRNQVAANLDLASKGLSLGKIKATQVGETEFFKVSVEHTDPILARDITNEVAQVLKRESELEFQLRAATNEQLLQFRLEQILLEISRLRQNLASLPEGADAQLFRLQLSEQENQYAVTLNSLEEAQLVSARTGDVLVVQSLAGIPGSPASSSLIRNLLLAVVAGLVVGGGAAFAREYFDDTAKSASDVHHLLGVPVIGALPLIPKVKQLHDGLILQDPEGPPLGEAYHMLRTNMRFSETDNPSQLILVTSSQIGEGKTTTVGNLGVVLAQMGTSTILVDADLRRPQLHNMFGLAVEEGLTDVLLQDNSNPDDYLKESPVENLSILTAGSRNPNPVVLLGSKNMQQTLQQLRESADVVLYSTVHRFSMRAIACSYQQRRIRCCWCWGQE